MQVQILASLVLQASFWAERIGKDQEFCTGKNYISISDHVDSKTPGQGMKLYDSGLLIPQTSVLIYKIKRDVWD